MNPSCSFVPFVVQISALSGFILATFASVASFAVKKRMTRSPDDPISNLH